MKVTNENRSAVLENILVEAKQRRKRIMRRFLTNKTCECGSSIINLAHEFCPQGICDGCSRTKLSPGAENIKEV
jgi:hypothetical protein